MSSDLAASQLWLLVRPDVVGPRLADQLGDDSWRSFTPRLIAGGKSNLTFELACEAGSLILRRPPTGTLLRGAHDMAREVTVQRALAGTAIPVAEIVTFEDDSSPLGVPYYVMERLLGKTVSGDLPDDWAGRPADVAVLVDDLIRTLVTLHAVVPSDVGLAEFGRGVGFAARQVATWRRQYDSSRTRQFDAVDDLHRLLADHVWHQEDVSIVHGDYRLDNCLVSDGLPPRVTGVLDWEMATLGDPLCDLGMLLFYWTQPGERTPLLTPAITASGLFCDRAEVADRYAALSGRDLSDLSAYVALAHFKFVGIAQGIAARVSSGQMAGQDFGALDDEIERIALAGLAAMKGL